MSKGERIASILPSDVETQYGSEAMKHNIEAVTRLSDVMKTTYGPYGQDKLIVDNGGNVDVTNETASILRSLHITDPVARVLRDVANTQIFRVGDGTTGTVLFLGALLERAQELTEQGLHPASIVKGYEAAHSVASSSLDGLAFSTTLGEETTSDVARTVLSGTSAEFDKDTLAALIIDAVAHVTDGTHVDLNRLRVTTTQGRPIADSELVAGAVIDAIPATPASGTVQNARILLVDEVNDPAGGERSATVTTDSARGVQDVRQVERELHQGVLSKVSDLGVDVVLAKSMENRIRSTLESGDVTCVSSVPDSDFRFLRDTLSITSVHSIMHADQENTRAADIQYEPRLNRTQISLPDSGTITLQLFSNVRYHGDEIENTVNDAIELVSQIVTDGRVLPGGGATEIELAESVRRAAASTSDRSQLAMFAVADALEELPRSIARNAGHDHNLLIAALRCAHQDGKFHAGIDVEDGSVRDMWDAGVLDTFDVKRELLSNAVQAACMVARIDGVIEEPSDDVGRGAGPGV